MRACIATDGQDRININGLIDVISSTSTRYSTASLRVALHLPYCELQKGGLATSVRR